jgi:hypothetical protein
MRCELERLRSSRHTVDDTPEARGEGRQLVVLESPYAGDVDRNVRYARACVRDSLARGEAPIASHLLYTQDGILRDDVPEERAQGIEAGLAWRRVAELQVFYVDLGISGGMQAALDQCREEGREFEMRRLGPMVVDVSDHD